MKRTYARFGTQISFVRVFFTKRNCSLACLIVQFGFVHCIQLAGQSCRVFTCTLKQTSFEVLLNDGVHVYAVDIVPSEVAWLPVKVKGIQLMKVFKSCSRFFF